MKRSAGVLMPITSLPSPYGIGTVGKAAYEFADFLKKAGQFLTVLWSVRATILRPASVAVPAILAGVISSSAHGDRHECI